MFIPDHDSVRNSRKLMAVDVPLPTPSAPTITSNPTLVGDSLESVKKKLAQIPEGKNGALVVGFKMEGFVPTLAGGVAMRVRGGWEIVGEAFLSKASQGASVTAVKTW